MKRRVLLAVKVAWAAAMLGVLAWFLVTHWDEFAQYAGRIGPGAVALSVLLLLAAKLLLARIGADAAAMFGFRLPYWKMFHIYSLSQLGKYLPGSVWQYVGRVMLYRAEGMPARDGAKALLVESYWLFGAAGAVGAAACAPRLLALAGLADARWMPPYAALAVAALALLFLGLWAGTSLLAARFRAGPGRTPAVRVFLLEIATWGLLGLAFFMLFPPELRQPGHLALAVGAFALGWAGGYIAIFAPAGVGVREAIVVVLLSDIMTVPMAVAVVSLSRILYSGTDLALGVVAAGWYGRPASAIIERTDK